MENCIAFSNETQFQAWCFQWAWNNHIKVRGRLFHINQKSMDSREGSKMKAMGVQKGISDFIFVGMKFVCFIEMKWIRGVQFKEQKEFENMVINSGHIYMIIKTPEEWMELISQLVNLC